MTYTLKQMGLIRFVGKEIVWFAPHLIQLERWPNWSGPDKKGFTDPLKVMLESIDDFADYAKYGPVSQLIQARECLDEHIACHPDNQIRPGGSAGSSPPTKRVGGPLFSPVTSTSSNAELNPASNHHLPSIGLELDGTEPVTGLPLTSPDVLLVVRS